MAPNNKRMSAREQQFIRFIDTVRETGNEPAMDDLDETISKLVPPVRAGISDTGYEPSNERHDPLSLD